MEKKTLGHFLAYPTTSWAMRDVEHFRGFAYLFGFLGFFFPEKKNAQAEVLLPGLRGSLKVPSSPDTRMKLPSSWPCFGHGTSVCNPSVILVSDKFGEGTLMSSPEPRRTQFSPFSL